MKLFLIKLSKSAVVHDEERLVFLKIKNILIYSIILHTQNSHNMESNSLLCIKDAFQTITPNSIRGFTNEV
ncbi:hypothetical protein BpHYR1_031181 [Brachionus plicatilis]|uniref:Uncharacterized protein n=1 Tax=Brachionus plicatilis TaxID=10195 RepID=A0A3M7PFR0_BRAPC|nr:hypothetical protein BpHYR1_031181 [Brachionus plicatilis]